MSGAGKIKDPEPLAAPTDVMAMAESTPIGRLIKIGEVVAQTSLHRATIYRGVKAGTFPRPRRVGRHRVAWSEAEIEAWKASLEVAHG